MNRGRGEGLVALLLVLALPLIGVWMGGLPVVRYLQFPPRTHDIQHEPFSWPVFVATALLIALAVGPILLRVVRSNVSPSADRSHPDGSLGRRPNLDSGRSFSAVPWWGWAGLAWTLLWWGLAWTRLPWMAPLQTQTFAPLWLGYIAIVCAWTVARTGSCAPTDDLRSFLMLFPASAGFWWLFEYLNRFVQNWSYAGVEELSALEYVIQGSVPFSTVLPAVVGTTELLASFPRITTGLDRWTPILPSRPRLAAWCGVSLACLGLLTVGLWPNYLFPVLWAGPLVLIVSLQTLAGRTTILAPLARGDWRPIWLPALAALVCGFFWELWNWRSLAHWTYSLPFVQGFRVFEMPLLGYSGYLPFGLECVVVAGFFMRRTTSRD